MAMHASRIMLVNAKRDLLGFAGEYPPHRLAPRKLARCVLACATVALEIEPNTLGQPCEETS